MVLDELAVEAAAKIIHQKGCGYRLGRCPHVKPFPFEYRLAHSAIEAFLQTLFDKHPENPEPYNL